MKTIAIINQKGGVGKSTTALALGQGLFLKGNRVLYVDLDPQGNLTYTLGANTQGYGAMGVLERPNTIREEIVHTDYGDILPSTPNLALADTMLVQTGKEYRLKEALELVKDDYDYCIIDNQPSLSILVINALTASYGVIIPANADIYSLQGINQIYSTINAVKTYCNKDLKVLGMLLTRYKPRSTLNKDITHSLEEITAKLNTRLYDTKIRECIALAEAETTRKSIYKYAPKSNGSKDYMDFLEEFIKQQEEN